MNISYISLDRIAEEGAKKHPILKHQLKRTDIPRVSLGRTLSDEQLIAKLEKFGLHFDRESLKRLAAPFISAQELTQWLQKKHRFPDDDLQVDWIWVSLTILWERWLPEHTSTEMIDDRMQKGYQEEKNKNATQACQDWLWTWEQIRKTTLKKKLGSVSAFDGFFGGTQSLFNWSQDLDTALWNTGLKDSHFLSERIRFAEEFISSFPLDHYFCKRFGSARAETYFKVGKVEMGEAAFQRLTDDYPSHGWSWIHWADCYHWRAFTHGKEPDLAKAERILKNGLAISGVEDRKYLLERLADVLKESDNTLEEQTIRQELQQLQASIKNSVRTAPARKRTGASADISPVPSLAKIGRNDPCICGSGKKYKKCCLNKTIH